MNDFLTTLQSDEFFSEMEAAEWFLRQEPWIRPSVQEDAYNGSVSDPFETFGAQLSGRATGC